MMPPHENPLRDEGAPPSRSFRQRLPALGITLRTALLAWLVTIGTLLIFIAAVLPQQRRVFLDNLGSKAHGVAVSLRDITAGAAVNEDYSSVVDHCTEILKGDTTIDFIVITRKDGFSLVCERSGWRVEALDERWRPTLRVAAGAIEVVPLFNRRTYAYAQPFDYSGIEWGWIHVGLSLNAYDESVAAVYRRTGLLALSTVVLALVASFIYARHLVGPILQLRSIVERVAAGDLTASIPVKRRDELGHLAESVNAMAEALLERDRILAGVQFAAQQFLDARDWQMTIATVVARLGEAAKFSRIVVLETTKIAGSTPAMVAVHEWLAPGAASAASNSEREQQLGQSRHFADWSVRLARGEVVTAVVRELPEAERSYFERQATKSFLLVPIMVEGMWWGTLSLADCWQERRWSKPELDSLRTAADMFGAAIGRKRAQDALLEAKDTLEHRVTDRTKELRDQVAATERVLAELAEAQQRLVDASRQAGMAEVATGVLHNVGNVLNSVNVSANVIREKLADSRVTILARAAELMRAQGDGLAVYLCEDPRGRNVPGLIVEVAEKLVVENQQVAAEVEELGRNIEHIKEIVAVQQSYARTSGVIEQLPPSELFEDAIRMNQSSLLRHGITVVREFDACPEIAIDRHKTLQILVNLISNAVHAVKPRPAGQREIRLRLQLRGEMLQFSVEDNGVGIAAANLVRIFSHGFTTRKDGHGFGLHSGALTARALGGNLNVHSDGVDRGALFTLELPAAPGSSRPPVSSSPDAAAT